MSAGTPKKGKRSSSELSPETVLIDNISKLRKESEITKKLNTLIEQNKEASDAVSQLRKEVFEQTNSNSNPFTKN